MEYQQGLSLHQVLDESLVTEEKLQQLLLGRDVDSPLDVSSVKFFGSPAVDDHEVQTLFLQIQKLS